MSEEIEITVMSPREYRVLVTQGHAKTSHRVTVPEELLRSLGVPDTDEDRLVRESFKFLLEREPANSILREFRLDVISRYFPEYEDALRSRLNV